MAEKLGISIVVGASVGASVASAFASVENRIKATRQAFSNASRQARAYQDVLDKRARRDEAKARVAASGGQDARALAEFRKLNQEYLRAARNAGTYGKSLDAIRERHRRLTDAVEASSAQLGRFRTIQERRQAMRDESSRRRDLVGNAAGLAMSGLAMAAPLRIGMGFEESMSRVKAISGASGQQLAELTAQARELGATTVWSAKEAAEGMTFLSMAGFTTQQTLAAMPGMLSLASAGAVDLGTTADIASNILTGFGFEAERMGYVGDVLAKTFSRSNTTLQSLGEAMKFVAPTASKAGQSFQDVAAMIGKLGDAGIQGSMAGTGLNAIIGRLAGPPKEAADAMRALGISIKDSSGNMRAMPDLFKEIAAKTEKMSEVQRLAYAKALFGVEHFSKGLVLMSAAAKGSLQEMSASLYEEGYSTRVAGDQTNNLSGDLKGLYSAWEEVAISLYDAVNPALRSVTRGMTSIVQKAGMWINANPKLTQGLFMLGGALVGIKTGALAFMLMGSLARSSSLGIQASLGAMRQGMTLVGRGARWSAGLFRISWGQALGPVASRVAASRARFSALRASLISVASRAHSTAAGLRAVGTAGMIAGARSLAAAGMAKASRMGWNVLRTGIRGVGAAFRVAFGPVSILMAALSFGVDYLMEHWESIAPFFGRLWNGVKSVFDKALQWMQPFFDMMGAALDKLGKAWSWLTGDEEKSAVAVKTVEEKAQQAKPAALETSSAQVVPKAAQAAVQPVPKSPAASDFSRRLAEKTSGLSPASPPVPEGSAVSVDMNFTLNGMPDAAFAQGVIRALRERQAELETIISGIVHNQARLAYGG